MDKAVLSIKEGPPGPGRRNWSTAALLGVSTQPAVFREFPSTEGKGPPENMQRPRLELQQQTLC